MSVTLFEHRLRLESLRTIHCFTVCIVSLLLLGGCHRTSGVASTPNPAPAPQANPQSSSFYTDDFSQVPTVPAMTRLGRVLFSDPALSHSGQLACASCHDPASAYGPPRGATTTQSMARIGVAADRAVPSLRYMQDIPPFSEHHFDESTDESVDQGPTGGHMWDGRADTLHDQAKLPLFSPREMANSSEEEIVEKVRRASYAGCFRKTFGDTVFDEPRRTFKAILKALEVFQQSPADFYPYTSKYDAWLRSRAQLTAAEQRGLSVFNDRAKGNCASCHPSQIRAGSFPQFTDYGYVAVGVPRNRAIAVNRDPSYFDMGLCGPLRADLKDHPEYCGRFRAPTLRNVALRDTFFHNGAMHDLRTVVEFYAERDTRPEKFYPHHGRVEKFDDLPEPLRGNVNSEPPFGGSPGSKSALSKADIADLLSFLSTLTDGYGATRGEGIDTNKTESAIGKTVTDSEATSGC